MRSRGAGAALLVLVLARFVNEHLVARVALDGERARAAVLLHVVLERGLEALVRAQHLCVRGGAAPCLRAEHAVRGVAQARLRQRHLRLLHQAVERVRVREQLVVVPARRREVRRVREGCVSGASKAQRRAARK